LIYHDGNEGAASIEKTDAGRIPGKASGGISRSIDGIDNREELAIIAMTATFL
jgi:hypothetical protein